MILESRLSNISDYIWSLIKNPRARVKDYE